jgi:hypothetical protein
MKQFFSGKTFASLLLLSILLSAFTTIATKADFSGEWKLDESKSELGEFGGRMTARSLKAEQKETSIIISRTTPGFNGGDPVTTSMTLKYDGSVTESEGFGGSKRKSTAKWSDDGLSLIVNSTTIFERDGQTNEFKAIETWSLTKEGLLSVVTQSSSPRGEFTTKAVYNK